jgi:hypothetical protein
MILVDEGIKRHPTCSGDLEPLMNVILHVMSDANPTPCHLWDSMLNNLPTEGD